MTEEWRAVPGWLGLYEASSAGRVRSLSRMVNAKGGALASRSGRLLVPTLKSNRYWAVTLADNDRRKQYLLHDLVAMTFLGPKPEGAVVRHLNDDKGDNAATNLLYGTHAENGADAVRNGRKPRGSQHPHAKLTEACVLAIRTSSESRDTLAARFGITSTHVWAVQNFKCWKHLAQVGA